MVVPVDKGTLLLKLKANIKTPTSFSEISLDPL
jgi:hypothetical protein